MTGYEKFTPELQKGLLDEKLLQYEASLYDATIELNIALAAQDDKSADYQAKRRDGLQAGLEYLRTEMAALAVVPAIPERGD